MKKFLSILLAVMMVLSTVSFAAPSLAGSSETAVEAPVVDYVPVVDEAAANLAATAGDKSSYGTLVYSIDFERDDFDVAAFSTAYAKLAENPTSAYMNPDFAFGNVTAYTNAGGDGFSEGALATEGDNTYITGNVASGYDGFFRMTKYNTAWPEGYYTFVVDVKAPAAGAWTCQCNDTAIALTTIDPFEVTTEWQTVAAQTTNVVNGADMYGFFMTPNNSAAGTVSYDNWEVYYRPATVTLTIEGNEYEVSTDNAVSAATLAGYVTAPTGYILSGLSLTEGGELLEGEQYFFEDTTLYPVFEKDPYMSDVYGKALLVVDFENTAAQEWWGHSEYDNSTCSYGAQAYRIAKHYDSRFEAKNFRVRYIINEGTHYDQVTVADDTNHYTEGTTYSQWPQVAISNWGNVTGEPGIYTYAFDTKISGATGAITYANGAYTAVDGFDGTQGVWDHVVLQKELTEAGNLPDGTIFNYSLVAADKSTNTKVAFDNLYLYYKPYTADVTLIYNGEEYLATEVSTEGVSADTVLAAAGLEIPYGKKAVLSATNGGESVGNVITLAGDATYYVSFVADDSISEYGKRLFLVDFEDMTAGAVLDDQKAISTYTDDFNGDWGHLTINWVVGTNTIAEEDGNKFVKGQQGWAQVRINNANYESAPAGYYTMALSVMNFGTEDKLLSTKDQKSGTLATWVKAGSVAGTSNPYPIVAGEWNEVAAQLDYAGNDFTIYHTNTMSSDVGFDNVALYYRPASVNLEVVIDDETSILHENCDSVVDIDTLLADIDAPFGYKAALSTEKNGEPITGSINLVSDAKLYVVYIADETLDMTYGKALVIVDLEREGIDGWWGMSQDVANTTDQHGAYVSEVASYYDSRFEGKNFRIRFIANESPRVDQVMAVDENGNHYITGSNTTMYSQVTNSNFASIAGEAGTYTYMFDVMLGESSESKVIGTPKTMIQANTGATGVWETVITQSVLEEDGNMPGNTWANFSFSATNVATVSFDNAKIYFKPFYVDVDVLANGAVVATKTDVSTSGVLASTLVDGVKVKGYNITGVKLGTTEYALTDTIVLPCDCDIELVLEEQPFNYATPTTMEDKAIRVDEPSGIRYKAELTKADWDATTAYGWIVTRDVLLTNAGLTAEDLTLEAEVNKQVGYNYDGVNAAKIFEEDDEYAWFTAILYFSQTEEDGLPSVDKLAGDLVARPFVVNDGETLYGDATEPASMFDIALSIYYDDAIFGALDGNAQTYIVDLLAKVDADGNDIPDIEE